MAVLADHISVHGRFARSANLERDADRSHPFEGYVVTMRALDAVERIATTAATGPAGGAWSLTGPYGSGKSSLALLLDAALGGPSRARDIALKLIDEASPAVADFVRHAHRRHRTHSAGFHRGLVTAEREPLGHTLLRALHTAVLRTYGEIPPTGRFRAAELLGAALEDANATDPRRTGPSPASLIEIARCLAEDAPLLLIVDEFGKNLEAIRDGDDSDPYLFQQLAEAGQGSGLPIFLLTLQHLSFEDYLSAADGPRLSEWAKVQGRFEDIAYVESARQTRALIGTVFEIRGEALPGRIARWARPHAEAMRSLGIADLSEPEVVASCYPLHPLAALILPELCSRYGQHERTLFSFLASPGSAGAASFLAHTELSSRGPLPSLGLDSVYDYFVASGSPIAVSAGRSSRWTEIAIRLRDIHGLSRRQVRMAKAVALLNLVSTMGTLRASSRVLSLIDGDSDKVLAELEAAGVVIYRDFADEYRIWHGTDVDLRCLLDAAHQQVQRWSLVETLRTTDEPVPVVAARHSAEHDMFRVFKRRYASGSEPVEPLGASAPYDGEVLLVVDPDQTVPGLSETAASAKPVVVAVPKDLSALERAAREVAAVTIALKNPTAKADWVARRELGERLAETQIALDRAVHITFGADACRWFLLGASGAAELSAGRGTAALSEAADLAYPSTPRVRNEMLNRTQLTSQGAKARRVLLEAMIGHGAEPGLGLDGYGPEVAMYLAFLKRTELHGHDDRNDVMVFRKPSETSLRPAWEVVEAEFKRAKSRRINLNDIQVALLLPPIGMKAGVIPVFVTAALLARSDEVAIYEHGTFRPLLTPELSERMVRNPGHFDIKHFANTTGARRKVIEALADRLGVQPRFRKHRVANVLSIVGHLVSRVRNLDNYTRRTRNLTATTRAVRDVLAAAVEPDRLLFEDLPTVLGLSPIPDDTEVYPDARTYADGVGAALDELGRCFDQLLTELLALLMETSAETTRLAIAGQAAALDNEVLNPEVRSLVGTLASDGIDADNDWIEAVATVVTKKAPAEWTDDDLARFRRELPQRVVAFRRLVALHAERRIDGGGPFNALRVTLTRQDGNEYVDLVGIDQRQRHRVSKALDDVLKELEDAVGSPQRARKALLALLGEQILSEQAESSDEGRRSILSKTARHG